MSRESLEDGAHGGENLPPSLEGPGYVYVLSNPSMPGIVKIGLTARPVEARMFDLHSTGVPTPFAREFALHVDNARLVEGAVHQSLRDHRVSSNREFFRVAGEEAKEAILKASAGHVTNADAFAAYARYNEASLEAMRRSFLQDMQSLERKRRFWRKAALVAAGPAALFVLTLALASVLGR